MSDPVQESGVRRRAVLIAGAGLVVVAVVVALVLGLRSQDDEGTAAASSSTSPASTSSAAPATAASSTPAAAPTAGSDPAAARTTGGVADDRLPDSLPAVALDQVADSDEGVSAAIVDLAPIDGTATGPGNVSGPALRVTVRIENGSIDVLDLTQASTRLTYGADDVPASPLDDPAVTSFSGELAPGDAAEATSVFTVPADARELVTVTVAYRAGASFLVFSGSAP